jgi:hypothetical protein
MRLEVAAWVKEEKGKQTKVDGSQGEEARKTWMPARQAVERAEKAGFTVSLPWISKHAGKNGVETRPRQLPGNHRLEVEWNSLAGYLLNKMAEGDDDPEPTDSERARIEKEKKAEEQKASGRKSLD